MWLLNGNIITKVRVKFIHILTSSLSWIHFHFRINFCLCKKWNRINLSVICSMKNYFTINICTEIIFITCHWVHSSFFISFIKYIIHRTRWTCTYNLVWEIWWKQCYINITTKSEVTILSDKWKSGSEHIFWYIRCLIIEIKSASSTTRSIKIWINCSKRAAWIKLKGVRSWIMPKSFTISTFY